MRKSQSETKSPANPAPGDNTAGTEGSLFRAILLVVCAYLIYGIMQGIHDNYGIMMKALVPETAASMIMTIYDIMTMLGALASASFGGICMQQWGTYVPLWIANMILTAIAATASYSVKECKVSER